MSRVHINLDIEKVVIPRGIPVDDSSLVCALQAEFEAMIQQHGLPGRFMLHDRINSLDGGDLKSRATATTAHVPIAQSVADALWK